ncbi:MAG: DUF4178 domain-containing protein [Butyrivibrio sp.]|nr:DUF4178 domain-containing protein [Butyrivibrio sp.]
MNYNELGNIRVGTKLNVDGLDAKVIGYVIYRNPYDGNKTWTEYRLSTSRGERWLSIDTAYNEYSISWPSNKIRGNVGPEWHKVDEGTQVVAGYGGDVDVDSGERAGFVEFEDVTEEKILSVETWSDGTEFSMGEYLDLNEIQITGYEKPVVTGDSELIGGVITFIACIMIALVMMIPELIPYTPKKISEYVKSSSNYTYETSITGNEGQKANVYAYSKNGNRVGARKESIEDATQDIIKGIEGYTESVTQQNEEDGAVAIVTKKEYCLIYRPDTNTNIVYVQVSPRKYNYTSDNAPYKSSSSTVKWYRSHYYSSAYTTDSAKYSRTPSAYSMYHGDTIHNIGNGYFDSYSNSVRQDSIRSRNSSSGGLGGGK